MPRGGKRPNAGRKRTKPETAPVRPAVSAPPAEESQSAAESSEKTLDNPFDLTPKELLFVAAYTGAAIGNATKSYALAGYEGSGSVARANACKLLTKDRVAKAIEAKLAARVDRLETMNGDEALQRISGFARADIGDVLGPEDPISQLPPHVRRLIKSVRPTRNGRSIELYDALKANELVAKASGKLRELHDVRVTRSLEDILAEANARQGTPA